MLDFAWSEIALIGVVALVAIGPKDMPVAIRTAAALIKKARRLAAEFQTHVDDMIREADLHDVRDQFGAIRRLTGRDEIERAMRGDGVASHAAVPHAPVDETIQGEAGVVKETVTMVDLQPARAIPRPPG